MLDNCCYGSSEGSYWPSQISAQKHSSNQLSLAFFLDSPRKRQTVKEPWKASLTYLIFSTGRSKHPLLLAWILSRQAPAYNCPHPTKGSSVFSPKRTRFPGNFHPLWDFTWRYQPDCEALPLHHPQSATLMEVCKVELQTYKFQESISWDPTARSWSEVTINVFVSADSLLSPGDLGAAFSSSDLISSDAVLE